MKYILFSVMLLLFATGAHAQLSIDFPTNFAGFSSQDLKVTIENIVRIVVGYLGILLIVIILAGGLKWIASGGNEDKIAEAKKTYSLGSRGNDYYINRVFYCGIHS